jgi:hypothetical protein
MTETSTTEVALVDPVFSGAERYALGAFLALPGLDARRVRAGSPPVHRLV